MSGDLRVLGDSQLRQVARSYWQIWAGMHWGFRRHACVLWCCAGQLSADRAYSVLGIDTIVPLDVVIFYRELIRELVPEKDLAKLIVDAMPLPERKHMKRFYAGLQVFMGTRDKQSIAKLFNEVFVSNHLPRLRESDDSEDNRIPDGRGFADGLRRTAVMRSEDPPLQPSKTPLIFIAEECSELIKTLPSLEYNEKEPEDTKVVGNEQDSIWEAAKICFRECPSIAGGIPPYIKRQMAIEKGFTPQQRYLNAIEYDRKSSRPNRIIKRR